ncbi:hypothetical protein K469DRAFT_702609 [Zopfia rhizophila CBS 207.26]|uniref:F-box domain-containing protein n=1 Tax=Zopfia rhizophila CBS 207.26 TaxID=1314779 RepID=A0A6A6EE92_9PEZI|nr:hypothetical protein K469DRAFT_702609 [Zopfia rhizophila CBS 207.26]
MAFKASAEVQWIPSHKAVSDHISFLDMPRELRDRVYEYAYRVEGAIFVYSKPSQFYPIIGAKIVREKDEGPLEPLPLESTIPIALMRTCRQIHAESSSVLYGSNIFRLYMNDIGFAPAYLPLVRHITFTTDVDYRVYSDDLDTVSYWWRRRFWPDVLSKSAVLLQRFPGLETLNFPIKSNRHGQTWRPTFLAQEGKTREQRIYIGATWLKPRCPLQSDRLRMCLRLEIMPSGGLVQDDYKGSRFAPEDEWDYSEFAEAFEKMKNL